MQEKEIKTVYRIYNSPEELSEENKELLNKARKAVKDAYAPYSEFKVGAAVRLADGKVIAGNNQEVSSYPAGLCAERVALFAAASQHPENPVQAIAITIKGKKQINEPIAPCGSCRQVLAELEYRFRNDIEIIMQGEEGEIWTVDSVKSILPFSFSSKYLNV